MSLYLLGSAMTLPLRCFSRSTPFILHPNRRYCVYIAVTVLFLCALAAGGCASGNVPLLYNSSETMMPTGKAPSVCILPFTDARPAAPIGSRKDGSPFTPNSNVSEWVTHALAIELSNNGVIVSRADNKTEAKAKGARYIVTGTVDELWLSEESSSSYSTKMRASLVMSSPKKVLLKKSFSAGFTRKVMPLGSVPAELLAETLRDVAVPMADSVKKQARP